MLQSTIVSPCFRSAARIARPHRFRAVGDHLLLQGSTEDFAGGTIGASGRG
jgi:hypothetical protein